ncbi:GNAT family N-acetyltransferase [Micromonospora maritima]|uniref:GNAT family N-acetyltransferase n=1 Tax=Micromonospora maritima TaxID=986711 RepID=A0ABW7ZHH0_9ACTN
MTEAGRADGVPAVRLRPVAEEDLALFRRFATEPGLIGLDWTGFTDPQAPARRFALDGWLGTESSRLMVEVTDERTAAGFVGWARRDFGGPTWCWEIGIALLPEWRGRGIGSRAQAMLCDYLFTHTPVQRIQAGTHPENTAEQRALVRAGFRLEGVVRACEFRDGRWCDGLLYSRLRTDPPPP